MLRWAGMAVAMLLVAWPATFARADTCYETAQVNIDCSPKGGAAAAPKAGPSTSPLRELLRQRLANGGTPSKPLSVSADALAKSIKDAEDRAQRALDAAATTSDPVQQDKAIKAYNAAIKDLDKAYDKAADAATPQGREELEQLKAKDEQRLADEAEQKFAAQREAAQAAQPKQPDNVGMTDGYVFVCDGPLQSDHVSCREVQPDGKSCVAVIAFDGAVNWRDSTAMPCSAQDLAQRAAYLASHDGAPDQVQAAAMSGLGCRDLIQKYVNAAQAQNGPRAQSAFEELNKAGGCGVLDKAEQQLKAQARTGAGGDPRFATRGDTHMIDQIFGACDRNPQGCAAAIDQARAGASPEAIAAIYANAIGIGLELGGMMGNAMLNAQAATMAHGAIGHTATVRNGPRGNAQYPRAISCNVRGCITTDGLGPSGNQSTITGLVR